MNLFFYYHSLTEWTANNVLKPVYASSIRMVEAVKPVYIFKPVRMVNAVKPVCTFKHFWMVNVIKPECIQTFLDG